MNFLFESCKSSYQNALFKVLIFFLLVARSSIICYLGKLCFALSCLPITALKMMFVFFWSEMFKWFLNETHGFERSFIYELLSTGALISLMHVVALRVSVSMSLPAKITHKLTYNDFISRFVSCKISDSFNVNAFLKLFFLKLFLITKSKFYCCVLGTCIFLGYFPVRKNVVFKCCFDEIQDLIDPFSDYVN